MNVGYVTAIAALAGAGLGGLTSFASSWTTLHLQMKAQRLANSKSTRQELYKQFIDEASRTYVDALVHDKLDVSGLVGIYALISSMRGSFISESDRKRIWYCHTDHRHLLPAQ